MLERHASFSNKGQMTLTRKNREDKAMLAFQQEFHLLNEEGSSATPKVSMMTMMS